MKRNGKGAEMIFGLDYQGKRRVATHYPDDPRRSVASSVPLNAPPRASGRRRRMLGPSTASGACSARMAAYDPSIIVKFAERLYSKALWIVLWTSLLGFVGGGVTGGVLAATGAFGSGPGAFVVVAVLALLLGTIGYSVGKERSFKYELDAQLALCQLQIEINTRASGAGHPPR